MYNVVHLINEDSVSGDALSLDVRNEEIYPKDINDRTVMESSGYYNIQSADSDDDPLIIDEEERSESRTSMYTVYAFNL
ncbi:unnamed protein product [Arctia plantaginis]|uniref:Uncharacterized protein n=1 Tax=Arctia plantaginis TaxID=874455 RepID=A0A8S0YWA8_ARCPL|nr:unnamed protein product [Arctia plantaginis]